jgi:hypothetical protein
MAERVLVATAPNEAMANIYLDRFQRAGLPVIPGQPLYPYPNAAAPVELWLTDAGLLDDPVTKQQIDDILHPPADAELPDEPDEPAAPRGSSFLKALAVLAVFLLFLASWSYVYARGREPSYAFLQGADVADLDPQMAESVGEDTCIGNYYFVRGSYQDVVKRADKELSRHFGIQRASSRTIFWRNATRYSWETKVEEMIYVWKPTPEQGLKPGEVLIMWAYHPSPSERIGHWLGR